MKTFVCDFKSGIGKFVDEEHPTKVNFLYVDRLNRHSCFYVWNLHERMKCIKELEERLGVKVKVIER
jgi:hypothetical protein